MIILPDLSAERQPQNLALIDADCVAYYGAFGCDELPVMSAYRRIDMRMTQILDDCKAGVWQAYLTGDNNFRDDIATLRRYKEDRYDKDGKRIKARPVWFPECRQYLQTEWKAEVVEKQEADDMLSIQCNAATVSGKYLKVFISTLDKDLGINACWYHEQASGKITQITQPGELHLDAKGKLKGTGLKFFYAQMLMGDRADCIVGLPHATEWMKETYGLSRVGGCGSKAAWHVLKDTNDPEEMERRVYACYESFWTKFGYRHWRTNKAFNPSGCNLVNKQFLEQGRLLWMRQEPGEMWEPHYITMKG